MRVSGPQAANTSSDQIRHLFIHPIPLGANQGFDLKLTTVNGWQFACFKESWLGKFDQDDKWIFCLKAARIRGRAVASEAANARAVALAGGAIGEQRKTCPFRNIETQSPCDTCAGRTGQKRRDAGGSSDPLSKQFARIRRLAAPGNHDPTRGKMYDAAHI
jgi:hypothetical protein